MMLLRSYIPYLATGIFTMFLLAGMGLTAYTLASRANDSGAAFWQAGLWKGQSTTAIDYHLKEDFILEDKIVQFWGALRYVLFRTGHSKVIIGKDGWLFTTEEFSAIPDPEKQLDRKIAWIMKAGDQLKAKGSHLLVVMVPAKADIYQELLPGWMRYPAEQQKLTDSALRSLQLADIDTVRLKPLFLHHKDQSLFLRTDTHWTPNGARLAAEMIASHFSLEEPPQLQSDMSTAGASIYEGDLSAFVPLGWLRDIMSYHREMLAVYDFTHHPLRKRDLFSDEAVPFALIGTSYSAADRWHFTDFLKASLQMDVVNLAEEGQGAFAPMQVYLERVQKDGKAEPYVVWEIPERFLFQPDVVTDGETGKTL